MKKPKIVLHKSNDGQYYYNTCYANGSVANTSELYKTKNGLIRALEALGVIWDFKLVRGRLYFVNGPIIQDKTGEK